MEKGRTPSESNSLLERHLFHGTDDEAAVRCIVHQNFDPRMHGVHGTVYGRGAYFATTAEYSHRYTKRVNNSRFMFYGVVLVGRSVLGKTDYKRPPPLDQSRPHGALYDTCVDNVQNPSIFVVFDNVQCYPKFLVEYTDVQPVDNVYKSGVGRSSATVATAAYRPPPHPLSTAKTPARTVQAPTTQYSAIQTQQPWPAPVFIGSAKYAPSYGGATAPSAQYGTSMAHTFPASGSATTVLASSNSVPVAAEVGVAPVRNVLKRSSTANKKGCIVM